jgi:hypothetical protein
VNQRRGVQGVSLLLAIQLPSGEGTQLVVHQGDEPIERRRVAFAHRLEQLSHVALQGILFAVHSRRLC